MFVFCVLYFLFVIQLFGYVMLRYNYDLTSIRRPIDWSHKDHSDVTQQCPLTR